MTTAKPVQGKKRKIKSEGCWRKKVWRHLGLYCGPVLTVTRMVREEQIKCTVFELEQQDDSNRSNRNLLECTSRFYANFGLNSRRFE